MPVLTGMNASLQSASSCFRPDPCYVCAVRVRLDFIQVATVSQVATINTDICMLIHALCMIYIWYATSRIMHDMYGRLSTTSQLLDNVIKPPAECSPQWRSDSDLLAGSLVVTNG